MQNLKCGKLKFGICKIGCWMSWTRYIIYMAIKKNQTRIIRNLFWFVAKFVKILNLGLGIYGRQQPYRLYVETLDTQFTMFLFLYYFFRLQIRMRNIWEWERVTDRDNSHNQKPWILQHNCPHVIWRKNWHIQSRLELNVRNYDLTLALL